MFAIYLPGLSGYDPQHLTRAGLGDLLDDVAPSFGEFSQGPDGARGLCATWDKRPLTGPDQVDWTRLRGGKFWLGKLKGEQPKPEWFARERQHLGKDVVLADGHKWHVPIARQLPRVIGLDDEGKLTGKIVPRYESFWEKAWATTAWWRPNDAGETTVSWQAGFEFACLALSINYRVNPDVCGWLGLISSDLLFPIADAVTEISDAFELQKKTDSYPSNTDSAGPPTNAGAGA